MIVTDAICNFCQFILITMSIVKITNKKAINFSNVKLDTVIIKKRENLKTLLYQKNIGCTTQPKIEIKYSVEILLSLKYVF